ncbi:MAG: STIV orfB116 family protein [Infirmifilum sp.]
MSSPSLSGDKAPPTPVGGVEEAQGRGATPGHIVLDASIGQKKIPVVTCWEDYQLGCGGAYYKYVEIDRIIEEKEKIVLLNAIVSPQSTIDFPVFILHYNVPPEIAVYILKNAKEIKSFIGHEGTAQILSSLTAREIPVNRAMYTPSYSDMAVVVRLKKRLERPEDIKNVDLNDLEFAVLWYW